VSTTEQSLQIERWDKFELTLPGPADGNPFVDVDLCARFRRLNREVVVDGFYDGDGVYRIRFMPDAEGEWNYTTTSNRSELDELSGAFTCVGASPDNHGPVHVRDTFHFAYADGTPYRPFGTTCYAWTHQPEPLQAQTLQTLNASLSARPKVGISPGSIPNSSDAPRDGSVICSASGSRLTLSSSIRTTAGVSRA